MKNECDYTGHKVQANILTLDGLGIAKGELILPTDGGVGLFVPDHLGNTDDRLDIQARQEVIAEDLRIAIG